jgi:hypothetical protein
MAKGKKLSSEVQAFIVRELAQFGNPSEVVLRVKEEFGLDVSKQQVHHYDPEHGAPAPKWRKLYVEIREKFKTDISNVGVAHSGVRLRQLDRMVRAAMEKRNYPLANELLVTAAKEVGGAFTNKKDVRVGISVDDMISQLAKEEAEGDGRR